MQSWYCDTRDILLLLLTVALVLPARAQLSVPFYDRYPGGLFDNPAAMSDDTSRAIQWQLVSFQAGLGTSDGNLRLTKLKGPLARMIREHLIPEKENLQGWGSADLRGPAVVLPLKNQLKLSVLTRMRVTGNFHGMDGRLISEIGEYEKTLKANPYSVGINDMHTGVAGFSELAVGLSKPLVKSGRHQLGGGVILKLLTASGHSGMLLSNLQGEIYRNESYADLVYMSPATGNVHTRTSGSLFYDFSLGKLMATGKSSIGADLGVKYTLFHQDTEKALLEIGVAVTDIGSLRYQPEVSLSKGYEINISGEERLYFNNHFNNADFSKTAEIYDRYPEFFTSVSEETAIYSVALPTAFKIQAQAYFTDVFSLGADASLNLHRRHSWARLQNPEWVRLMPQWSIGNTTWTVPVTYSTYQSVNSGIGFRYKGIMLGSNSLFSSLISNAKVFDFYLGVSGQINSRR